MTTIKDIAKYAHVSIGTVSNYLTKAKPVSQQKALQIEHAIQSLHYIPNHAAQILKSQKNPDIGVILPTFYDQYYVDIFYGIQSYFSSSRFVNIYLTNNNPETEQAHLNLLLAKKAAGIIIASCQPDNYTYFHSHFDTTDIPIIEIDRKIKGSKNDYISFDNKTSLRNLTLQLLRKGYCHIFLLTGPSTYTSESSAIRGYLDAFEEYGKIPKETYIHSHCFNKESAFKASLFLLSKYPVDAIIATSETLALGICESLELLQNTAQNIMVFSLGQNTWNKHTKNHLFHSTERSAVTLGAKAAGLLDTRFSSPQKGRTCMILQDSNTFSIPEQKISLGPKTQSIHVLMVENQLSRQIRNLISVFENQSGIHVDLHTVSHKHMFQEILEHHTRYDVFTFNISWLHTLIQHNILAELTFLINNEIDPSIYLKDSIHYFGEYHHKVYGIPFMYSPQILYYRKDLFEDPSLCEKYKIRYHLSLRPPRTWKEFHYIAEFFTKKLNPDSPTLYGTIIPAAYNECLAPEFYTRLGFYHASIWNEKNFVNFTEKNLLKAYCDFIDDLKLNTEKFQNTNYIEAAKEFMEGNTAMIITYPSYAIDMIDIGKSTISNKIGYASIPGKYSTMYGQSLGITSHSKKKEASCKFIGWLCGKSMGEYITLLSGQSMISEILEDDYILTLYPWLQLFPENFRYSKPMITPHNHRTNIHRGHIDTIICKYIYKVLSGELTPETAAVYTEKELQNHFENHGFPQ